MRWFPWELDEQAANHEQFGRRQQYQETQRVAVAMDDETLENIPAKEIFYPQNTANGDRIKYPDWVIPTKGISPGAKRIKRKVSTKQTFSTDKNDSKARDGIIIE